MPDPVLIEWERRAVKDFGRLEASMQSRISAALDRFSATEQGNVRKLTDVPGSVQASAACRTRSF